MALNAKTKLVGGQRVDINTGLPYTGKPVSPITPQQLNSTTPPAQIPPVPPPQETKSPAATAVDALEVKVNTDLARIKPQEQSSFDAFISNELNTKTPTQLQNEAEASVEFQGKKEAVTKLQNDLNAEQERVRREIEQIQSGAGTATTAQRNAAAQEAQRLSYRTQADISVPLLAAQGNLRDAQDFVDKAVKQDLEIQQKKSDVLKLAYDRNKELFDKTEQRQFEIMLSNRQNEIERDNFKYKAELQAQIDQRDPIYQLNRQIKQKELDKLNNPDPTGLSPDTLERIQKLPVGSQEKLVNSNDTIQQLQRIKQLVAENDIVTLSNPSTEAGRTFQRLSTDVADKLARERTGAVVTKEENENFKRILGLSLFNRALAPADEINSELDYFIQKHESVRKLIDPTGEIVAYLGADSSSVDSYLDKVETASGVNDPFEAYLDSLLKR